MDDVCSGITSCCGRHDATAKLRVPFGVAALIWHPTERDQSLDPLVLTVSRRGRPDDIGLPGGKVEPDQSPLLALICECREELGIEIEDATILFEEMDSLLEVNKPPADRKIARTYLVSRWSGEPRTVEDGCIVRWATIDELLAAPTFGWYNKQLFDRAGARGTFPSDLWNEYNPRLRGDEARAAQNDPNKPEHHCCNRMKRGWNGGCMNCGTPCR